MISMHSSELRTMDLSDVAKIETMDCVVLVAHIDADNNPQSDLADRWVVYTMVRDEKLKDLHDENAVPLTQLAETICIHDMLKHAMTEAMEIADVSITTF